MSRLPRKSVAATSVLLLSLAGAVAIAAPASAATFDATDEATLVDAINSANATPESDVISISAVDIVLTGNLPAITEPVTITGAGFAATSIRGDDAYSVFTVNSSGELVIIEDLTVAQSGAEGITTMDSDLWLRNLLVTDNSSDGLAHNGGDLTIDASVFTFNGNDGANAFLSGSDTLIVQGSSRFDDNDSDGLSFFADSTVTSIVINSSADSNGADGFDVEVDGSGQATLTNVSADSNDDANYEFEAIGENTYIGLTQADALNSINSTGVVAIASGGGTIVINRLTAVNNRNSGVSARSDGEGINRIEIVDSSLRGNGNLGWIGGGLHMAENPDLFVTVTGTSISGNFAGLGGGIVATLTGESALTVDNSTISSNLATTGGGIYVEESDGATGLERFLLRSSTLYDNADDDTAGGVARFGVHSTIRNTSIGGNFSESGTHDLHTDVEILADYNLIQTFNDDSLISGAGNIFATAPMLGTFDENGGVTRTHAPLEGSPLINAGTPVFGDPFTTDQRGEGFDRVADGRVDIGAVELQVVAPIPDPSASPDPAALPPTGAESMQGFVYAVVVLGFGMLLLAGAAWRKSRSLA